MKNLLAASIYLKNHYQETRDDRLVPIIDIVESLVRDGVSEKLKAADFPEISDENERMRREIQEDTRRAMEHGKSVDSMIKSIFENLGPKAKQITTDGKTYYRKDYEDRINDEEEKNS